jgi:3-(3-hydroxy-phenyl)propionate hydroxylase
VILCEAEPALTVDLRAGSFHPPTLEMMAPYGITQRMHETGIPVRHWQIRDRTGEFIAEFDLGLLADVTAYPYRLHLEQHRLTPIQLDILRRDTRVDVRFSHRVTGFAQHADGVTVTVDANGKPQTIAASWLIGADGGRSIVRKLLGVGFEGFTWPENFLVVSTPHDLGEYGYPYMAYVSDPLEWAAVFRMPHDGPPGIWRLAFPVAETMSEDEALGEESVERRMQGFLPRPGRWQIIYKSIYRVHQRVADTFRIGHVLLGGDAAHLNNPLGGFGLNSTGRRARRLFAPAPCRHGRTGAGNVDPQQAHAGGGRSSCPARAAHATHPRRAQPRARAPACLCFLDAAGAGAREADWVNSGPLFHTQ